MVQNHYTSNVFRQPRPVRLFRHEELPEVEFPIQSVQISWDRLIDRRPQVLSTVNGMPAYLLKPEIMTLLDAEKHPTYRLILDLMWSTGARISEVLALTPNSFIDNDYEYGVTLKTLRKNPGRPSKISLQRSPGRYLRIFDNLLEDRIHSYLHSVHFKKHQRIFPMTRQTVNRHIKALIDQVGGFPFSISCKTFRHSFAIHLLFHCRQRDDIAMLLGLRSTKSTEIYTNVLTIDGGRFLEGVDFH